MNVLMIGPSIVKSKGGMATVIRDILEDRGEFCDTCIKHHDSYADGSKFYVALYSIKSLLYFFFFCRNYDIYHIHMASKGSFYRKMLYIKLIKKWNKKIIIHIHGGGFIDFYNNAAAAQKETIKKTLNSADAVIALSSEWRTIYCQVFGLQNCIVVENGIDTKFYKRAVCKNFDNRFGFLLLGRMTKRKGTYDLIEAVNKIVSSYPLIKVFLAGDGEIEKTKEIVRLAGLDNNIIVVGWINKEEKIELLKKVATVILPSYHEALPMSILEGMAAGKVIISTKVGAIPEVVTADNGFILQSGDLDELANALSIVMSGNCKFDKISKNNIDKMESYYSLSAMHKKLRDCYYDIYK